MKTTNEVMLRAPDLDAVRAYYSGTLGLPIILENGRAVGFGTGAINLYFERGEPNGSVFEIEVHDVQSAKHDMLAKGCELVEEDAAIPRVYMRDPFGLLFNITKA